MAALLVLAMPLPVLGLVVINEIHPHPQSGDSREEFIELWNRSDRPISLYGWQLSGGLHFEFPDAIIPAKGFVVVAADLAHFRELNPGLENVIGEWTGRLSNRGEKITLLDASQRRVDEVRYADEGDWARRARGPLHGGHQGWIWEAPHDGGGHTLELIQPGLPNNHGQNWGSSQALGGTPGRGNSIAAENLPPMLLDAAHAPPIPTPGNEVTVTVRVIDEAPSKVGVTLHFREDEGEAFSTVAMLDNGLSRDGPANNLVFGAVIPPFPQDKVVEFFFTATDIHGSTRTWPRLPASVGDSTPRLLYQVDGRNLGPGRPLLRIITTENERRELEIIGARPWYHSSDARMNATLISHESGRHRVRYLVGVRLRGSTTRALPVKSRRVHFRSDDPWMDRNAIQLNALNPHVQEIGGALFRMAGLPALRARAVRVLENNSDMAGERQYGHFVQVDTLDSDYIRWQFPNDPSGNLYKGGGHAKLEYLGDDPLPYGEKHFYDRQTNASENHYADLIRFLGVLHDAEGDGFSGTINGVMDVRQWLRHLAVHVLIGNEETSLVTGDRGDYALYAGKNGRFILLPYDLDAVMGINGGSSSLPWRAAATPALGRVMKHPSYAHLFWEELDTLARTVFSPKKLDSVIDRVLSDYVPEQERIRMKLFAAARSKFVLAHIPRRLTTRHDLPKIHGIASTDQSAISLGGRADAIETRRVWVNGNPAEWSAWEGKWSASAVALRPGQNRIFIQAIDAKGKEMDRLFLNVWREVEAFVTVANSPSDSITLKAGEGPHLVTKQLVIPENQTLTIEAGTTLLFSEKAGLLVQGRLLAVGKPGQRIQFTRPPGTRYAWGGLAFNDADTENRLSYVDFHFPGSYSVAITNSVVTIDHAQWHGTRTNLILFQTASLALRDSVLPTLSHSEHVRGIGIRAGGQLIFERNQFGATTGYSDILDVSGAQRPGPILQVKDNTFLGGPDDALDLDGMDAHIEGNLFMNFAKNNISTGIASAVATGRHNGQTSHLVVTRNRFINNDHDIGLKEGCFVEAHNNTFYGSRIGSISFDEPGRKVEMPRGAVLAGNIFWGGAADLINLNPVRVDNQWVVLRVNDSLIRQTLTWTGGGNIMADPLFVNAPSDFRLRQGSPAIGTGSNGIDMGAMVPGGATVSGIPRSPTREPFARLNVSGPGITHYRFRLDSGATSAERPVDNPILLNGLDDGEHWVEVIGRDSAGIWRDWESSARAIWTVNSGFSRLMINEVLAQPNEPDDDGNRFRDWIELFNDSASSADLSGTSLTDNPIWSRKFVFPAGTTLGPGQFLVIEGGDGPDEADPRLGFNFKSSGEAVHWFDTPEKGGRQIDSVTFGPQLRGLSIGRVGNPRKDQWTLCWPTPKNPNHARPIGDSVDLRIHRWLANPAPDGEDFVELFNPSPLPVPLGGLALTTRPYGDWAMHTIPPLAFISSRSALRLIADGQIENGVDHLGFNLPAEQGMIGLFDAAGKQLDLVVYSPQPEGTPQSSEPTSDGMPQIVIEIHIQTDEVELKWNSEHGTDYTILTRPHLREGTWSEAGHVQAVGSTTVFTCKIVSTQQFFQIRQTE